MSRRLVAGGAGFIGAALRRRLLERGDEVVCVDNLIDPAIHHGARFLQASTSEVYGDSLCHPQPETYFGNVNPIGPRAVYDKSKRFSEALVIADHRRGADTRIVRIFNTYGPGMRLSDGRAASEFIRCALLGDPLVVHGDGTQTRTMCYVEDLVTGLLDLLASEYVDPVNLGTDDELPIVDLARMIIALSGSTSKVVFTGRLAGDPQRRRPDLTLARRLIGWAPPTSPREGLAATIAWCSELTGR